jgi:hypothetical protein
MLDGATRRSTSAVLERHDGDLFGRNPPSTSPYKTITIALINLITIAVSVAWLVVACYVLADLASR